MEFSSPADKPVFVKTGHIVKRISGRDILYVSCEGNVSQLSLKDGSRLTCVRLLKLFEEDLAGAGFIRINHNCLANVAEVMEIRYVNARKRQLLISDGSVLDVSYRKWKAVKEALLGRN